MIEADEQLAARVQTEEQELYSIEEKSRLLVEMIAERKRFFATQRATEQKSKPPTKTQMRNRMCTYLKNMGGYKHNQLKGKSYEEIQKLSLDKNIQKLGKMFVPMASVDKIWKLESLTGLLIDQREIFDSCGILRYYWMDMANIFHMLVEKTYPLTQEMLSRMLSGKLEVDNESEMDFELLRFTRSQIEK
ncbi:hypothetical protein Tco_0760473 [Tanacetum coccineum]